MFLLALLYYLYPPMRITVVGQAGRTAPEQEESSASMLAGLPLYAQIRILEGEEEGCRRLDGKTTYYVCKGHTCLPPTNAVSDFYHKPDEKHLH